MRTSTVLAFVALASACGSSSDPAAPAPAPTTVAPVASTTPPPSTAAPPPSSGPPAATPPSAPPISPDTARRAMAAVREGRREAHAGHLPEALAAFDRALALVPGQPRVLCEAGFLAHRAGDETTAARRIDQALHMFGPPARVLAPLREPLAMCLYNRGLVAEAESDPSAAIDAYAASVALRPNATVSAALARLEAAEQDESEGALHLAGARIVDDVVEVTTIDALIDVLRHGMRGYGEDDAPVAASAVNVRTVATLERPSTHAPIALFVVDDGSTSYAQQWLVLAERVERGFRVGALEAGSQDLMVSESNGDVRMLGAPVTRWVGDVLEVRMETAADLGSFDEDGDCSTRTQHTVGTTTGLWAPSATSWVSTTIAESDGGTVVERYCESDEGEDDEGDEGDSPEMEPTEVHVEVEITPDAIIARGSVPEGSSVLEPGRHTYDELSLVGPPEWVEDER